MKTLSSCNTLWIRVLFVLVFLIAVVDVDAAHSRKRIVIRRGESEPKYDRSITTFSSDGRLLQVEYGMEASNRGNTVIALSSSLSSSSVTDNKICIIVPSTHEVFRIDDHVFLFGSGLLGDIRALASHLRSACQRFRLSNGEAPTINEIATIASQLQHDLTRMGGARPLGCTAILVGIDPRNEQNPKPKLFRTGPGGGMEECMYCTTGKENSQMMKILSDIYTKHIIGEEENNMHRKKKEKNKNNNHDNNNDSIEFIMAKNMIDALDMDDETCVNIWTIQPDINRRGKMHAICQLNVNRNNLYKVVSTSAKQITTTDTTGIR